MRVSMQAMVLAVAFVLVLAQESRGDIGLVVMEPIRALGLTTRVGHAGTYLSNICPDRSPVRMRLCRAGERGSILSKYSDLGGPDDYDWAIVAFDRFLHGAESPALASLIATPALHEAIQSASFDHVFSGALDRARDGAVPAGQWKTALATRFDRSVYILTIATSEADDRAIVEAFNGSVNKSRFNFFYVNCSNQTKAVFDLLLSGTVRIGDRKTGLSMQTPKGLAKTLVDRALADPGLKLRVERHAQLPGTVGRSREVLFPMQNTYRNLTFAPYWYFGGFREVALGALIYHQVIAPFRLDGAFESFLSPSAAALTAQQHRLRGDQDEARRALRTGGSAAERNRPAQAFASAQVFRELRAVESARQSEVHRVLGSPVQWQAFDREFRAVVREWRSASWLPEDLRRAFAAFEPTGRLSRDLLTYLDAHGHFYVDDEGRGAWISLSLDGVEPVATGLSASQVLTGDRRLSFLVLAAVIDYNLYTSDERRETVQYMDGVLSLFQQARSSLAARP